MSRDKNTHSFWFKKILFVCLFVQGILDRLNADEIVIGDGGFVFALEKRGYVKAGPWTPEAAAEHPEAGDCHPFIYLSLSARFTLQNGKSAHLRKP